jgi:hypothetical protein
MITMRPGYETLDRHGTGQPWETAAHVRQTFDYRSLPFRHYSEMRRRQTITEHLANGSIRQTIVDGADLEAAQSSRGPASLQWALDSGDPDLALRARKLQLLKLSG